MTEAANKDDPLRPLPNGIVPHPQDFVIRLDFMSDTGMHAGYLRVLAVNGTVELNGFPTPIDDKVWAQLEKLNPAIVKLCRILFVTEARIANARREMLNVQEASIRAQDVLNGKRPAAS